jgi:hypothetical protein
MMTTKGQNHNRKFTFKTGDIILIILFFTSMFLTIWAINIYRLTIIDIKYLVAIIAFGIITSLVTLTFLKKSSYSAFWTFFIKAGIGGGLFYFGLLFLNQKFADKELSKEQFQIIKKGMLPRGKSGHCKQPYVVVSFYGVEKELIFYCQDAEKVKYAPKINLTYSRGLFGFIIIKSKDLSD